MVRKILAGAALLAAVCFAAQAQATNITLSLNYVESFDADFNSIGTPLNNPNPVVAPTAVHQFAISYAITDPDANEDFQGLQFDMVLGPGFAPSSFGYIADTPLYDPAGPTPNAGIYGTNTDGGSDATDLQRITVIANANTAYVHGFRPGIVGSGKVGDAYLTWDGTLSGNFVGLAPNGANPFSTYIGTTAQVYPADAFIAGPNFVIQGDGGGELPVVTDFVDTADFLEIITTDLQATNGPNTWSFVNPDPTYTPGFGALPGAPGNFFDATLEADGTFSFNTKGATRGTYVWNVQAQNATGPGTGTVTIIVDQVPEPAAFTMLGLAAVGLVGLIRRRS